MGVGGGERERRKEEEEEEEKKQYPPSINSTDLSLKALLSTSCV